MTKATRDALAIRNFLSSRLAHAPSGRAAIAALDIWLDEHGEDLAPSNSAPDEARQAALDALLTGPR